MAKALKERKQIVVDTVDTIREDKSFRRAKTQFTRIMDGIDLKMLLIELNSLHVSRGVTAIKTSQVVQDALRIIIDSSVDEISVRSRATTIKMTCLQASLEVEELVSYLSKYILSRYTKHLKEEGATTITAQKALIEVILRQFIEARKKLEAVMKIADLVTTDIDQASYGLSRIQNAIETASKDR